MIETQASIAIPQLYCATCETVFATGERCPTDQTRLVRLETAGDPLLGKELDGRYTIKDKLGEGGMGSVYRAEQHSVGREVAVKVINPRVVSDPDAIRRFLREAKLASRLTHPNAVGVLDFGQTSDGLFYLAMELVTGRTLDLVLKQEGTLSPARLIKIGAQICDALEGAHALAIVHRDLKPSNVMVLATGRDFIKVLDFGLAKSLAPDHTSTTMTGAGALLGTPAFMPPELATGQPCDARADLYSLGCILYLAGSGHLPFQSTSVHELVAMHGHVPAPPMTGVPAALAAVIDRLLAKDPGDRYASAAETRDALEATMATTSSPSITAGTGRLARSATEVARLGESATLAGATAASTLATASPRQRWPLLAGAAGATLACGLAIAIFARDDAHDVVPPAVPLPIIVPADRPPPALPASAPVAPPPPSPPVAPAPAATTRDAGVPDAAPAHRPRPGTVHPDDSTRAPF